MESVELEKQRFMRDGLKLRAELRMRAGEGVVEVAAVMKRGLS